MNDRPTIAANLSEPFGIHMSEALALPNNRARSAAVKSIALPVIFQVNPVRDVRSLLQVHSRADAFILNSPTILDPIAGVMTWAADPTPPCSWKCASGYMLGVE